MPLPSSIRRRDHCSGYWALLALLIVVLPLRAATPREDLLRLVPEDVGFCVVLQDLRERSTTFLTSPFADALRGTPVVQSVLRSPEMAQLQKLDQSLSKNTGMNWPALRDNIFGDAVVFAFRPGPPGKSDRDQGAFFVRARSEKALIDVLDRLTAAQKESGELKSLTEREHRGVTYFCRVDQRETNYFCRRGPILVVSAQEPFLREVIDRMLADAKGESVSVRQLRELGLEKSLLAVWLNPRAYDAAVLARANATDAEPGHRTCSVVWKALEGIGLGLELNRDVELKLVVRAREAELPMPMRRSFAEAGRASELWRAVPDNALVAVASRVDAPSSFEALGAFMNKDSRAALEATLERRFGDLIDRSVLKDVLPAIGPDWGMCVSPPDERRGPTPRSWLAVRLGRAEKDDPVAQAVLSAIHFWATGAALAHNSNARSPETSIRLKTMEADKISIRYATSTAFPPGLQPAVALKGGYLIVASSPDVIARFGLSAPAAGTSDSVPLMRVSFRAWRDYLRTNREELTTALAAKGKSPEQVREHLDSIRANLEPFERLEVRRRLSAGQVTLTAQLQSALPRKSEP
jgi:hypothetical protein